MKLLSTRQSSLCAAGLVLMFWASAATAQAQYKVVNPDGGITYTDRPPTASNARVTSLGRAGSRGTPAAEVGLPSDLRSAVQRYPVTLYTGTDCAPCDSGRRLLQQRGVPYSERRVTSEEDAQALQRLVGGRTVPSLTIGPQPLRGFSDTDWSAYLDVAGYPRESKLPRGWPTPEPMPMVEREVPAARAAPAPEPRAAAPAEAPQPSGSIRF